MCLLDGLSVCLLSFRLKNGIPGPDGADVAIEGRRGRLPFRAERKGGRSVMPQAAPGVSFKSCVFRVLLWGVTEGCESFGRVMKQEGQCL